MPDESGRDGRCHTPSATMSGHGGTSVDRRSTGWPVGSTACSRARRRSSAGMTRHEIEGLVSSGRWLGRRRRVYALASHPSTWEQRLMAAVLGEPDAAVGGRSAAALHGLTGFRPGRPEIVVPRSAQNRSPIALVRRRDDVETTRRDGLPVLTVRDTLFAVAGLVPVRTLVPALDDALGAGWSPSSSSRSATSSWRLPPSRIRLDATPDRGAQLRRLRAADQPRSSDCSTACSTGRGCPYRRRRSSRGRPTSGSTPCCSTRRSSSRGTDGDGTPGGRLRARP